MFNNDNKTKQRCLYIMQQKQTLFTVVCYLYRLSEDTEFLPHDVRKIDWSELVFLVERAQEQEIGKVYFVNVRPETP